MRRAPVTVEIDMQERTALVTGAGSGIGRRTAPALGEAGTAVAADDIVLEIPLETAGTAANLGIGANPIEVDDSDWASCLSTPEASSAVLGRLEVLSNSAEVGTIPKFADLTHGPGR